MVDTAALGLSGRDDLASPRNLLFQHQAALIWAYPGAGELFSLHLKAAGEKADQIFRDEEEEVERLRADSWAAGGEEGKRIIMDEEDVVERAMAASRDDVWAEFDDDLSEAILLAVLHRADEIFAEKRFYPESLIPENRLVVVSPISTPPTTPSKNSSKAFDQPDHCEKEGEVLVNEVDKEVC